MSPPRFLDRAVDAAAPILGSLNREAVREKLEASSVKLIAGEGAAIGPARTGFLFAANLVARLYPRIELSGPDELVHAADSEITLINPAADVVIDEQSNTATLAYEVAAAEGDAIAVSARGWNVYVDTEPVGDSAPAVSAALAAATLGVGELFRVVFADELGARGRRGRQPGSLNVITLDEPSFDLRVPETVDVGTFRLVGVGAIGQAAAKTLADAGAHGTIIAVDHEQIALSNLQRYVLARDGDVGALKVDLLRERLATSGLEVVPMQNEWHAGLVNGQLSTLVALDSPEARIGVQASLPGSIYNAWTQPADVGWSRHERFGEEPCLACLYWPDHERPSRHEQIAAAFRQHPLRVLAYLVHRTIPIGRPLPAGGIPAIPAFESPPDAERWLTTPLLDDIAAEAAIDVSELVGWRDRPLADVYQEGICGGALLHLNIGVAPREVLVPLAHQSALAGVMLATDFLVAQVPELRAARAATAEARYDVLAGLPQMLARPRAKTSACLCADAVFQAVYRDKLAGRTDVAGGVLNESDHEDAA